MWTRLLTLVNPLSIGHIEMWPVNVNHMVMWTRLLTLANSFGVNHMAMWTRLLTLVNPLSIGHMAVWTMGVNHMVMWTIGVKSHDDVNKIIDFGASGRLKEICPRGNNKVNIYFLISW